MTQQIDQNSVGTEQWNALAQQLRVDSIRASTAAGVRAPHLEHVGRRPHGRADEQVPALRLRRPRQPEQRPPDLLQGPRLAAALRHVQGGRRDQRRGAADLPQVRQPPRRATRRPSSPGWTSPPAPWARACPSASASRWRASTSTSSPTASGSCCGDCEMAEGSMWEAFQHASYYELDNLIAILDMNRLGQTRRDDGRLERRRLRRPRPRPSAGTPSRSTATTPRQIDRAYAEALDARRRPPSSSPRPRRAAASRSWKTSTACTASRSSPTTKRRALEELGGDRRPPRRGPEAATPAPRRFTAGLTGDLELPTWRRRGRGGHPRRLRRRLKAARRAPARTSSPSTARSATPPTPRTSPRSTRSATSRCSSPSSRWSPRRSA